MAPKSLAHTNEHLEQGSNLGASPDYNRCPEDSKAPFSPTLPSPQREEQTDYCIMDCGRCYNIFQYRMVRMEGCEK